MKLSEEEGKLMSYIPNPNQLPSEVEAIFFKLSHYKKGNKFFIL